MAGFNDAVISRGFRAECFFMKPVDTHLHSGEVKSYFPTDESVMFELGPRPLISGDPFAVQVSGGFTLSQTWEQMFSFTLRVLPLFSDAVYLQLLISLTATMMAMTTIRITRTIRR